MITQTVNYDRQRGVWICTYISPYSSFEMTTPSEERCIRSLISMLKYRSI